MLLTFEIGRGLAGQHGAVGRVLGANHDSQGRSARRSDRLSSQLLRSVFGCRAVGCRLSRSSTIRIGWDGLSLTVGRRGRFSCVLRDSCVSATVSW